MGAPVPLPSWPQLWEKVRPHLELRSEGRSDPNGWVWARCVEPANHKNGDVHFSLRNNIESGGVRCMSQGCRVGPNLNNLAERLGVEGQRGNGRSASDDPVRQLAKERLLSADALREKYGIRTGRGGWAFPVDDPDAKGHPHMKRDPRCWADEDAPKNWWPKDSEVPAKDLVYGLSRVPQGTNVVYVAAGEIDHITLLEAGYPAVTFLAGEKTPPSRKAIRKLIDQGIGAVVFVYDNDDAGTSGAQEAATACACEGLRVHIVSLPDDLGEGGDINDLWVRCNGDRDAFDEALQACPMTRIPAPAPTDDAGHAEPEEEQQPPITLTAQTAEEFLAEEISEPDVIISDGAGGAILSPGEKVMLAGPPGVGKTNIGYNMAAQLAAGRPVLGLPCSKPWKVLYALLEGNRGRQQKRLRKVFRDAEQDTLRRFHFTRLSGLDLSQGEHVLAIEELCRRLEIDVLFIDPFREAHPWGEDKSEDAARIMRVLNAIISVLPCLAIVLIHHVRKPDPRRLTRSEQTLDQIRGSGHLVAACQSVLLVNEGPNEPDKLLADWVKHRDAEERLAPMFLYFDRDTLSYEVAERPGTVKVTPEAIVNAVLSSGGYLEGPALVSGLMEGAGVGERTVRDAIRKARDLKLITEEKVPGGNKKAYRANLEEGD